MKTFSVVRFLLPAAVVCAALPASAQIAAHVQQATIAGIDVVAYPTGVKDVVTIHGSLPAGDAFAGDGNVAVPTLTGMLLDKGTTTEDKFAIAQKLESVGATISFDVGTQTLGIEAKCLKQDLPLVIQLIAEQLRTPALTAEDFEKAKKQYAGSLQRQLESTDYRAVDALSRAVYPVGHPNRNPAPEEMLAAIQSAKLDEVKAFHAKYYGPAHLTLVAVGDVDVPLLQREVGAAFAGWTGGVAPIHPARAGGTDAAKDQDVFMADKTSVTVIMGEASGLRYSDPDYQALKVGTAILGSGFTGRLMSTVRDQEGLTYGIYSTVAHDTFSDGDWRIQATFAPALLEKGISSTQRELTKWVDAGVTDTELAKRKTDLIGSFKVGLATTDGMAGALLAAIERGVGVAWLDEYPKKIESLTTAQVNAAIKKYVKPESLFLIKAGTIPGAAPAAPPAK